MFIFESALGTTYSILIGNVIVFLTSYAFCPNYNSRKTADLNILRRPLYVKLDYYAVLEITENAIPFNTIFLYKIVDLVDENNVTQMIF